MKKLTVPVPEVTQRIFLIRGHRVMIDRDLAEMYGVETKTLNQAVKRNSERFPDDFMFQATKQEAESLRSQIVTSKVRERRETLFTLRFYRTGSGDAVHRS